MMTGFEVAMDGLHKYITAISLSTPNNNIEDN